MTLDPRGIREMYQALTEFGYPLTESYVRETAEALLKGETAMGGPAMFIRGWLSKAGLISEGKKEAQ